MKTSLLILAAAVGLAMTAMAQEFYSVDHSKTTQAIDHDGNIVITDTLYTDSFYHGQTKQDTVTTVTTEHPAHYGTEWPLQTTMIPARPSTTVSLVTLGDWIDNTAVSARTLVPAPQAAPRAQAPVTVVDGPMTPAQIHALINGQ